MKRRILGAAATVAAAFTLFGGMGVAHAAPGGNNPPKSQGASVQPFYGFDDLFGIDCAVVTHKSMTYLDCS